MALELLQRKETGIFARIASILTRPKAALTEETVLGVPFGRLTAPLRDGRPPWEEIGELAGRFAGRLLLPDGVRVPEDFPGVGGLRCPRYERRVLTETAAAIIRRTRMPLYRRVLGLIDRDAACTELVLPLLRHYTQVKVVTAREDLYTAVAERAMEELGAPVQIGQTVSLLADCVLILAAGPAFGEEEGRYPCPVLAAEAFLPELPCDLLRDPEPEIPPGVRERCPPGIAPHRFAAALYEEARIEAGGFISTKIRHNQRRAGLEDIVKYVTERAGIFPFY